MTETLRLHSEQAHSFSSGQAYSPDLEQTDSLHSGQAHSLHSGQAYSFQIHPSFRPTRRPLIDRAQNRMYGLVAAMDVEATGHGVCCDKKSLDLLAALGNAHEKGVAGRFGHPGMSENATGRKVQLAYNWRVAPGEKEGDGHHYLLHDALMMEAARTSPAFAQDPIAYIMNMAEQHPEQLAESLVIAADTVWTLKDGKELPTWEEVEDEDGYKYKRQRKRPDNALTNVPVLRPTKLYFVDFVNEGALTHSGLYPMRPHIMRPHDMRVDGALLASIFTDEAGPNQTLAQIFAGVDELRQRFQISLQALSPKVMRLLDLYVNSRALQEAGANVPVAAAAPLYYSRKDEESMSATTRRQRRAFQRLAQQKQQQQEPVTADEAAEEAYALTNETEETLDRSTAILAQAEQLATTIAQSGQALQEAPSLASAVQVAHLQEQVDQHTDQLHELTNQLKRLSELLVKNMELTAVLQRNITRSTGEPVITQPVRMQGVSGGLEGFNFAHPGSPLGPGQWAVGQQPVSVAERQERNDAGVDPDSPEGRAIAAQRRRALTQRGTS